MVTLNYSAASAGQSLTVTFVVEDNYSEPWGNVTLQAATLKVFENSVPELSPIGNQTVTAGTPLAITVSATDDGPLPLTLTSSTLPGSASFIDNGSGRGTFSWTPTSGDLAGSPYSVTFTATDGAGLSSSETILIAVGSSAYNGVLQGSSAAAPATVSLSTEGTRDWAHWGLTTATSFNHKSGVTSQIGNYTLIGTESALQYNDNPSSFKWSSGIPTASVSSTTTGVFIKGINNGFKITVPANTTSKTLKVYCGLWHARGHFSAILSDGSAPMYTATMDDPTYNSSAKVITLNFKAASSGQTLTLIYVVEENYGESYGNVTLQAATLINN